MPRFANDGYEGMIKAPGAQDLQAADYEINRIDNFLNKHGVEAPTMNDLGDTLFTTEQVQAMSKGFGTKGFQLDPRLTYAADKLGVDPLSLLNSQREANGLGELPPPPSAEVIQQELTPLQQQLLNKFKSPERSQRGLSGVSTFKPELLPGRAQQYATTIQSAAKKYDIPEAILAGLIETESSWIPGQISKAGARGLAQFMPATAAEMGVNVNDPTSSINGAAKYLRHLMDNYGMNLHTAIKAYNGGPGGIDKSRENREYLPKVLKSAGKYGYGQSNRTDMSTIRPSQRSPAIVSTTNPQQVTGPTNTPYIDQLTASNGEGSRPVLQCCQYYAS